MTIEEMKQRKKELGYTNQKLSELSHVPLGTVSKIFSGTTSCPHYKTIQALEAVLKKKSDHSGSADPYQNGMPVPLGFSELILHDPPAVYDPKHCHTLKDYLQLPEGGPRKELIDGTFYDMGEPTAIHQVIINFLLNKLTNYVFENKGKCVPLSSPVSVQLDADDKTVVEPDILVVCDRGKFTGGRIMGAPDLVIEVLSPSTRKKDMGLKAYKYQNAGVREYWLVDPKTEQVLVYNYEKEAFPYVYGFENKVSVRIWSGACVIDLKEMKDYISFLKE